MQSRELERRGERGRLVELLGGGEKGGEKKTPPGPTLVVHPTAQSKNYKRSRGAAD